jgi:membrane protease subunit HflK
LPGGGQIPDLDEIIARVQAFVRRILPGGGGGRFGGGRAMLLGLAALVALWLASGFYRVQPDEQGVVLRFGAFVRTALPGLNYHVPWPVETVLRPSVTRINRIEIGYGSGGGAAREVPEEGLMLTGDENIIDINFAVFWRVKDAVAYLFNTRTPAVIIKAVAESAMREVIGRTPIQPALTEARASIETGVASEMQTILDAYGTGVEITQVQLQKVDPPSAVIDSFRDVQRANTDAERMRNEAEAYRNDIVPRARGDAARVTAEAEGARLASIAEATGQTQRFLSVLTAYQVAKQVTLDRMYIEAMQDVLSHSPATVVDGNLRGLVPFLPLTPGDRAALPPPPPGPAGAAPGRGPQR